MHLLRLLALSLVLVFAMFAPGPAAFSQIVIPEAAAATAKPAAMQCLDRDARRSAIAEKRAVPLAQALLGIHRRPGELVNARLCHDTNGLVYVLTLLPRDGKVARAMVDATNGAVVNSH